MFRETVLIDELGRPLKLVLKVCLQEPYAKECRQIEANIGAERQAEDWGGLTGHQFAANRGFEQRPEARCVSYRKGERPPSSFARNKARASEGVADDLIDSGLACDSYQRFAVMNGAFRAGSSAR